MRYLPFVIGAILILLGIRAIYTKTAVLYTFLLDLWSGDGDRYESSGLIAQLIGLAEIALGIYIMAHPPSFLLSLL